jgi:hypothetical protein
MDDLIEAQLSISQASLEEARRDRIDAIESARGNRWSWTRIGKALGMSDQGARRLYERAKRRGNGHSD